MTFAPKVQTARNKIHAPFLAKMFGAIPKVPLGALWFVVSQHIKQRKQTTFIITNQIKTQPLTNQK